MEEGKEDYESNGINHSSNANSKVILLTPHETKEKERKRIAPYKPFYVEEEDNSGKSNEGDGKTDEEMMNIIRNGGGKEHYLIESDWKYLRMNGIEREYRDGETIWNEGNILGKEGGGVVFRVEKGSVRIVQKDSCVIARMGSGSVIGDLALLGNYLIPTASIVAEGNVSIVEFEVDNLIEAFEAKPPLALKFYKSIATKLSSKLRSMSGESIDPADLTNTPIIYGSQPRESWDIFTRKNRTEKQILTPIKEYPRCHVNHHIGKWCVYPTRFEFERKTFGMRKRWQISFLEIENISKFGETGFQLYLKHKSKTISFALPKEREEVYGYFLTKRNQSTTNSILNFKSSYPTSLNFLKISKESTEEDEVFKRRTDYWREQKSQQKKDWKNIVGDSERKMFAKGETILERGDLYQRMFRIITGKCLIVIKDKIMGELHEGEVFGEMSFLQLRSASASIIAGAQYVEIAVIEGYKLHKYIRRNASFGARFFLFLSIIIQERISRREEILDAPVDKDLDG
eukprot:TRINITY_DN3722_c1_g2_i1.p1 TRINITY_DN3722_c1_g2~~TRINITY_DN3722_c1_g2_i1.p1  ORF type:complete len:515 (-),score=180.57 TRINITY_DN3722_c1_g2_i1:392-1936(-)